MNNALKKSIDGILKFALAEDKIHRDITSKILLDSRRVRVGIYFNEIGILCGREVINYVAKKIDKRIKIKWDYNEGDKIKNNARVAIITGPASKVIPCERIILNFLQKLSGIATLTNTYITQLKKSKIKLLDTRKTTPGWRYLEKYAVTIGGGQNHRKDLSQLILIKDNHIKICGNIRKTLEKISKTPTKEKIEVEVKKISEINDAVKFKINRIMLDNFNVKEITKAIKIIRNSSRAEIELSGNLNLKKIKTISKLDIDYVSVGRITHSAPFLNISINVLK
jgi:nicotinate-nucleotide pyrophosphorylase